MLELLCIWRLFPVLRLNVRARVFHHAYVRRHNVSVSLGSGRYIKYTTAARTPPLSCSSAGYRPPTRCTSIWWNTTSPFEVRSCIDPNRTSSWRKQWKAPPTSLQPWWRWSKTKVARRRPLHQQLGSRAWWFQEATIPGPPVSTPNFPGGWHFCSAEVPDPWRLQNHQGSTLGEVSRSEATQSYSPRSERPLLLSWLQGTSNFPMSVPQQVSRRSWPAKISSGIRPYTMSLLRDQKTTKDLVYSSTTTHDHSIPSGWLHQLYK